jgi:hypothetical protein
MHHRLLSIPAVLMLTILSGELGAESFRSFESPSSQDEAKKKIEDVLNKIAPNGYRYLPETIGFSCLIEERWNSPFEYRIFIGAVSKKIPTTLIRIEGDDGEVRTLSRVFELEGIYSSGKPEEGMKPLHRKSHIVSQGLNWIAPWIGTFYDGYHSPRITTKEMFMRSFYYFLYDAFAVYAGSRNFFVGKPKKKYPSITFEDINDGLSKVLPQYFESRDPIQENAGGIMALMFLSRAFASYDSFRMTSGHNTLVELKYTFAY